MSDGLDFDYVLLDYASELLSLHTPGSLLSQPLVQSPYSSGSAAVDGATQLVTTVFLEADAALDTGVESLSTLLMILSESFSSVDAQLAADAALRPADYHDWYEGGS